MSHFSPKAPTHSHTQTTPPPPNAQASTIMLSRVFTSAMRPAVQQTRANATRMATSIRHKGTAPLQSHYGGKPKGFKETWLMDGATYPIIVIITFAVTMCSSFTAYKFFNSPDNRVDPRKRSTLLRDWTK